MTTMMKHTYSRLSEGVRSVHRLKIDGFSGSAMTMATINKGIDCIKQRCTVDGYNWEIVLHPAVYSFGSDYFMVVELVFLGGPVGSSSGAGAGVKVMLEYMYTDAVPEFEKQPPEADEELVVMAQNLLVAADRYGLDRLKAICEHRLSLSVGVATVASTLALAVQHCCSDLKARCVEFIAGGSSEDLEAVLATEEYRHVEASSPSVLTELSRL